MADWNINRFLLFNDLFPHVHFTSLHFIFGNVELFFPQAQLTRFIALSLSVSPISGSCVVQCAVHAFP
ncbi:hypothetical protein D3C74_474760 [compost metagenome]